MKPQSCLICKLQGKTFKATTLTTTKIQLSAELQTRKKMKDEKVKSFVQVGEVGGVGGGGVRDSHPGETTIKETK